MRSKSPVIVQIYSETILICFAGKFPQQNLAIIFTDTISFFSNYPSN